MTNLFSVSGQTLTPIEVYPAVSDTVNYLTFSFVFNDEWDGLTKSAIFTNGASSYEVVLTDDEVLESDHVNLSAGVWQINVVGDTVVDAVVTRQITTSYYNFPVAQSVGTSGETFPPSIANQVYINVNQATPQTFVGGIPKLAADRVIDLDNELADKKYVDDTVATVTRDSLGLDTDDTVTFANLSGTNTGDQVLPTRDSLGLDTDDNVTFANLSGTNTGDQNAAGVAITDAGGYYTGTTVETALQEVGANKVDKTGTGQVTPINISGVTAPSNLFSTATLEQTGKYVDITDGHIAYSTNASYNSYIIPVENAAYLFTFVRFGLLLSSDRYTAVSGLFQNLTEVNCAATGAAYIAFSFNTTTYPTDSYSLKKRSYAMPNWSGIPELQTAAIASAGLRKPKSISVSGNIASGGSLYIATARNNLRKNEKIVFTGDITTFSSMEIGLTYSSTISTGKINRVIVDATNITVYTDGTTPTAEAHGLTIASNLQVVLEQTAIGTVLVTIISAGESFAKEYTWARKSIGTPYALSSGTTMVNCKLSWTCSDLNKSIWVFGDSYLGYSSARWTYYLHSFGYDANVLLDGFAGEGGVNGIQAIKYLVQYGAPRYLVWCLGMNDGTDSATPNTDWVTYRDQMLALCVTHNITPVFGTIPTVPTINNEQKNAWIRASGYRYIDFAKSVGANSSGVWYTGMLAVDNVHPTALGAKALNARALADLPEMMVSGQ